MKKLLVDLTADEISLLAMATECWLNEYTGAAPQDELDAMGALYQKISTLIVAPKLAGV